MKNMKNGITTIVLAMTLAIVLGLTGCITVGGNGGNTGTAGSIDDNVEAGADGSGQQKIYADSYSFDPPEGFSLKDNDEAQGIWEKENKRIQVFIYDLSAEMWIENSLSTGNLFTQGEDVTFGDNTWKVLNFTCDFTPSYECVLNLGDDSCAGVIGWKMGLDDEAFQQVLSTITFQEDAGKKYNEFCYNLYKDEE